MNVKSLDHLVLTVRDLQAAIDFYTRALGMAEVTFGGGRKAIADLVIGTRMTGADSEMPRVRRVGNAFFAGMLTLIGRTPVTDSASGMRVFRRKTLDLLSPLPDGLNLTRS